MDLEVRERAARTRLVIFDIDGVLTDGRLFIDEDGREHKSFHVRDGHGIKLLRDCRIEVGIISGRSSGAVAARMSALGVVHVHQGQDDKLPAFEGLLAKLSIGPEAVAYLGDDVLDLPVMRRAGLAAAVADAHPLVKRHAHWCTNAEGGRGAARELCELVLEAQGLLGAILERYLNAGAAR